MMYYSTLDVFRSWVFQVQFAIALCINFGVNFGFEWATLSDYGERDALVDIWFWKMNAVNTSIVADVLLTSFLIGYLPIVLATWGIKDEVRKKFNTHPIHKSVLDKPEWKLYWPVRVQGVCKRGVAFGFFFTVVLGLPYAALLGLILNWDETPISGKAYCGLKACYCLFATIFIFPGMYFSAISSDKFERPEYAYLTKTAVSSGYNEELVTDGQTPV